MALRLIGRTRGVLKHGCEGQSIRTHVAQLEMLEAILRLAFHDFEREEMTRAMAIEMSVFLRRGLEIHPCVTANDHVTRANLHLRRYSSQDWTSATRSADTYHFFDSQESQSTRNYSQTWTMHSLAQCTHRFTHKRVAMPPTAARSIEVYLVAVLLNPGSVMYLSLA